MPVQLLHGELTHEIIGAFFTVQNDLGFGFLEQVYANALAATLSDKGIPVAREVPYQVRYRGRQIGWYRADLVVDSKVIVETKAGRLIDPAHVAQLGNYMKASGLSVGLLLNFGVRADFKRVLCTDGVPRLAKPTA